MTIRDLIDSVGGVRSAARLLGIAPSTAHYYCKHNRIPLKKLMVLAAMSERMSGGSYQCNEILRTFG